MMPDKPGISQSVRFVRMFFALGIATFVYWLSAIRIDVYATSIPGVLFELLSIPVLLSPGAIPIIALITLIKGRLIFVLSLVTVDDGSSKAVTYCLVHID
jgi:hypothetical protein